MRTKDKRKFVINASNKRCYLCSLKYHPRSRCPAKDATSNKCNKIGPYQRLCQAKGDIPTTAAMHTAAPALLQTSLVRKGLFKSCLPVEVNGKIAEALIDSGGTDNFIHPRHAERCDLQIRSGFETVLMASSASSKKLEGHCVTYINVQGNSYPDVKLHVFPDLCADIILGQDWQAKHLSATIAYGGKQPPLKIRNLTTLNADPPQLFEHLSPECKPIAAPSRKYSQEDCTFISSKSADCFRKE